MSWSLEQSVLSATNPLLRLAPNVEPSSDPAESWFAMKRCESTAPDDAIGREAATLLGA